MCILHNFNYYLPDFVTAICLGFIFGFSFLNICFNLTQHSENEDHGIRPITSWQIDGETVETVSDFIFWAPKSLQMVTAAMKSKDTYSLEEKL